MLLVQGVMSMHAARLLLEHSKSRKQATVM